MLDQGNVQLTIQDQIGTIVFYHPKSNSMSAQLLDQLADAFYEVGINEKVKVVILRSHGETTFCAGASFEELKNVDTPEKGKAFFMGFAHVIQAMRTCPKLIIGCIEGKTVGGGVGIIAACDYTFANDQSLVKLSELSIGIGPFVVELAVRRRIGLNGLTELTLKPTEWHSAQWSKGMGLFSYLGNDILQESLIFARQLTHYSLEASAEIKRVLWRDTDDWEKLFEKRAEISGRLVLSDFTQHCLHS